MQHFACLTINYHVLSGKCELLADILQKEELFPDVEWVPYGHVYSYVLSANEYSLAYSGTLKLLQHFCH